MKWIRGLAMMALLATAVAASAQTAPPPFPQTVPQPYLPTSPQVAPPAQAYPATPAVERVQAPSECPFMMGTQTWYVQTLQDANTAWQRLRLMCGSSQAKAGCCEGAASPPSNVCKGGTCASGITGCAKGCEVGDAPKTCCCAKACACCETCKAAKEKQIVLQMMQGVQGPVRIGTQMQWAVPAAGVPVMPTPPMMMPTPGLCMPPMVAYTVNLGVRPAKLVTPDFEIHCEKMTQRGDSVELVGNVMLLCKKHAQPLRIEAQRVVLNLRDGSFVVEASASSARTAVSTSVQHMNPVDDYGLYRFPSTPSYAPSRAPFVPTTGVIEVVPVPTLPTPVQYPR